MVLSKPLYAAIHAVGWVFFFGLMLAFTTSFPGGSSSFWDHLFSAEFLLFASTYLIVFYFNSDILVPKLYFGGKALLYFLIIALIFLVVFVVKPADGLINLHGSHDGFKSRPSPPPQHVPGFSRPPRTRPRPQIDIMSLILFTMIWAVSTALQILKRWRSTERRAAQAETDKVNAELAFLKAQINPHFLFNTLNNIYSLTVTKSDRAPDAIMKLSKIMRYVADEATQEYVPLEWEEECIRNYIDLQRLRLNEKAIVDYSASGSFQNKQVAPLIIMTFIENVFKYGISSHEPSVIVISLSTQDNTFEFFCQNNIFNTESTMERAGIGIDNSRKRLQHLYPGKHDLAITTEGGLYTVKLALQLS